MKKRIAIIDCGTNTFNLLIGEYENHDFNFIYRTRRVVKIGTKSNPGAPINEEALARAFDALKDYRALIDKYEVDIISATGTAALRDSANGRQFVSEINDKLHIDIKLISGSREASLIYKGVRNAVPMDDSCCLVMDIGGGSTEFVLCNDRRIFWKKSFRLGAARLLAIIEPSDPIKLKEIKKLKNFLKEELKPLTESCSIYKPMKLIGSSGSFDTFASLILSPEGNNLKGKTHYRFKLTDYRHLHRRLMKTTQKERLKMPGMSTMRADMIVTASILLSFVLKELKIRELHLSKYALKEGLFTELISKRTP